MALPPRPRAAGWTGRRVSAALPHPASPPAVPPPEPHPQPGAEFWCAAGDLQTAQSGVAGGCTGRLGSRESGGARICAALPGRRSAGQPPVFFLFWHLSRRRTVTALHEHVPPGRRRWACTCATGRSCGGGGRPTSRTTTTRPRQGRERASTAAAGGAWAWARRPRPPPSSPRSRPCCRSRWAGRAKHNLPARSLEGGGRTAGAAANQCMLSLKALALAAAALVLVCSWRWGARRRWSGWRGRASLCARPSLGPRAARAAGAGAPTPPSTAACTRPSPRGAGRRSSGARVGQPRS